MAQGPTAQYQHGRFATASGNGRIDPAMAESLPMAAEYIGGARFTACSPPVQHLYILRSLRCTCHKT